MVRRRATAPEPVHERLFDSLHRWTVSCWRLAKLRGNSPVKYVNEATSSMFITKTRCRVFFVMVRRCRFLMLFTLWISQSKDGNGVRLQVCLLSSCRERQGQ